MKDTLIQAYRDLVNTDTYPINAYTVAQKAGISEQEFYAHFASADAIGSHIWTQLAHEVSEALHSSAQYREYPARQKVLSYFFTFFEVAVKERTFIDQTLGDDRIMKAYKTAFKELMQQIVEEGLATDDIKDRLYQSRNYPIVMWELHMKLVRFWLRDESEGFAETEKAVENYSKLPLEMMGPNLVDSMVDTVKYELERRNIRFSNPFKF